MPPATGLSPAGKDPERTPGPSGKMILYSLLPPLGVLTAAAISTELSRLCLSPVYGSISSAFHVNWEFNILALVWITNAEIGDVRKGHLCAIIPTLGCAIPVIIDLSFPYSRFLGPRWAPFLLSLLTVLPLMYLSLLHALRQVLRMVDHYSTIKDYLGPVPSIPPVLGLWFVLRVLRQRANVALQLCINTFPGSTSTRFGFQMILSLIYGIWGLRKKQYWNIALFLLTVFNVHVPTARNDVRLNEILSKEGYSLVARQESVTGYISVLDNVRDGFRVMRCDHSLLGGEWLQQSPNSQLKEPVYSVFVMLEAVRLVETEEIRALPVKADSEKTALIIGLGVGTSATALHHHGVHTTVIEIDRVVYAYASRYFNLPSQINSIIADALPSVKYLLGESAAAPSSPLSTPLQTLSNTPQGRGSYDMIIHDVFTGGAEPLELFTVDFLSDLAALLNPERGAIAINYAGNLRLPTAAAVVQTTLHVFNHRCRLFRESPPPSSASSASSGTGHSTNDGEEEKEEEDFTNLTIFCLSPSHPLPSSSSSNNPPAKGKKRHTPPFTFRPATERDYLGTASRQAHLIPEHEIDAAAYLSSFSASVPSSSSSLSSSPSASAGAGGRGHTDRRDGGVTGKGQGQDGEPAALPLLLLTRENVAAGGTRWAAAQDRGRWGHWEVMRHVVPDAVWENW